MRHHARLRSRTSLVVVALATLLVTSVATASAKPPALVLTHGIAAGDISARSAVIWARASGQGELHVEYDTDPTLAHPKTRSGARATADTDFTAQAMLTGLRPNTRYFYRVWFSGKGGHGRRDAQLGPVGSFRTAPDGAQADDFSFVVAGDLGGQRYCRNVDGGYAIFSAMRSLQPDFFIANGDLIYADGDCPAEGPDGPGGWENIPGDFPSIADPAVDWTNSDQVREVYLKHWRYNRADPALQQFLQSTPMYAQWDDHEVINDFGALWDYWNSANASRAGYPNLVREGRDAFFNYSPIARDAAEPTRIYRSFNWGSNADLLITDARSYRDRNDLADTPENDKTMLGDAQLAWLKQALLESTATWKIIASDVPLAVQTGSNAAAFGRDAWANGTAADFSAQTGFERELLDLLAFIDEHDIDNVVFLTTDVHFAQSIRYTLDANGDGDELVVHEFISGPINAVRGTPGELDPTLNPTSLYAEGNLFNFAYVRVATQSDGLAHLIADVRDADGVARPGSTVDLTPSP